MSLNPARVERARRQAVCPCGCATRVRRYPSDLTDAEWAIVSAVLPPPLWLAGRGGRPERHHRRAIIDAIRYVCDNGIKWRALPGDFPPWATVYGWFAVWTRALVWEMITDRLRAQTRVAAGRRGLPSAAAIDSQSVHASAEGVVGKASSGFDPHKRVNGRKRHIATDVLGLLICVMVTAAHVQDREAAFALLVKAARRGVRHVWADKGYAGAVIDWAYRALRLAVQIVQRSENGRGKGFHILPRRWVVERTFAWITRRRRCARDYERQPASHEAWVHIAAQMTMTRQLARRTTRSA
jgi:transposase